MSTAPVPTQGKKSNALWWVLGFAGIAVAVLLAAGLFVVGYFVQGVRVNRAGREVEVRTPVGPFTVSHDQTGNVGLPVYPGATLLKPGDNVQLGLLEDLRVGVATAQYRSPDPQDKVDTWYRGHLGPDFERQGQSGEPIHVHGKAVDVKKDDIVFVSDKENFVRVVVITKKDPGAQITLVRVGAQEAQ
jgi:hypothetical protein